MAALVVLAVIAVLIPVLIEGKNIDVQALVGAVVLRLVIALLIWLAGRACLYVLAGR